MAYSDFSLKEVSIRFGLTIERQPFSAGMPSLAVSAMLQAVLDEFDPLARAINTEKARSELLIAPILVEARKLLNHRVSLFSGVDFPAAPEQGLSGVCDFLMSRSSEQNYLLAPVIAIVEAKKGDLGLGLGQCIAAMVGARFYNERDGRAIPTLFGVVTTGTLWQFLRLDGTIVGLDPREYPVEELGKILGILAAMLTDPLHLDATTRND